MNKTISTKILSLMLTAVIIILQLSVVTVASGYTITDIALTPGRNSSELNFAWFTAESPDASIVQIALSEDMEDTRFPIDTANTFTGTISLAPGELYSNQVTVSNLRDSTEYIYRLGDGNDLNWSPIYTFATHNPQNYEFIFVGDPQIGRSSSTLAAETQAWAHTVKSAVDNFPGVSFLLSAGDQVQQNKINLYNAFFAPKELQSLPIAAVQGNHDTGAQHFALHFNLPNASQYGKASGGGEDGDYYYVYGDTLFMFLNSNNQYSAEHNAFMRETTAANPHVKWKVLMFHHSIYSTASHHQSTYVQRFINGMGPVIDELGIDLVLMGHDHVYVRTHQMKDNQPQKDQAIDGNGYVVNPTGTLYLTGNSSTGSKYYDIELAEPEFAAVNSQLKVPTFSHISVAGRSLSINTYRTDTMEVVDTYKILKHNPIKNAPGLSLDSFSFMQGTAKIGSIDKKQTDEAIHGTATISNDSATSYDFQLMLARYGENNQLIDVRTANKVSIPAYTGPSGGSISKSLPTPAINISEIQEGEYLRLFLWRDTSFLTPYSHSIELREDTTTPPTPPNPDLFTLECEDLPTISSGAEESDFIDNSCSNGAGNMLGADEVGDYVQYDVVLPSSGKWNISIKMKTGDNSGSFRLYLPQSEKYVGTEQQDQYSENGSTKTVSLGTYTFNSAGTKQFRFLVTGKNALSNGYTLSNDAIVLTKQ